MVKLSLANLRLFPWIAEREKAGLAVAAWRAFFDVRTGLLALLSDDGRFSAAVNPLPANSCRFLR